MARRLHRDEAGQSLVIVLALITFLFLVGSALAAHASVALRTATAGDGQADDFHAADAGAELGIWWQRAGRPGNPPTITVNGLPVSTTVSVAGGGACSPPTPIRVTGFEAGAVSAAGGGLFSAVSGSGVTADSATARSGGWSLRIDDPAGSRHNATVPAAAPLVVVRLHLRLDALPAANVTELLVLNAVSGSDLRLGYQAATERLTLRFGSAAATPATTTIAAATWVRVDVRLVANANRRTADWQLDGVAQPSISWVGTASTVNGLRLGSTVNADTYVLHVDDVAISATAGDFPIGEGGVLPLRPDATGTSVSPGSFRHEDGSPIDAATHLRLDDDPLTSTADFVAQQTADPAAYVELGFEDTGATCIHGASGTVAYRSAASAANNGRTSVLDGATELVVHSGDMSVTSLAYASAVLPRAGGWTMAAVNALRARIGYSTDVSPNPYWDALLLEVATGAAGPGTVTVTASAGDSTVVTTYEDAGAGPPVLLTWSATR